MLLCKKCGKENQLGRVFCMQCGGKLDLDDVTYQEVEEKIRTPLWRKIVLPIVVGLLLVVVALAGLAFWPSKEMVGEKGTLAGSRRVETSISTLPALQPGTPYGPFEFTEQDINGFFEFTGNEKMKVEFVRVSVREGFVVVKVVRTLSQISAGKKTINPSISIEAECVPSNGLLIVRKIKMGHLPMFGPLRGIAVEKLQSTFAGQKEWDAFKGTYDIKAGQGKIQVWVKK